MKILKKDIVISEPTIEEARQKLEEKLSPGIFLIKAAETPPVSGVVEGYAATVEKAFEYAEKKLPKNASDFKRDVLREASTFFEEIAAFSREDALDAHKTKTDPEKRHHVQNIQLARHGKKGFLGIGKKPDMFRLDICKQALVRISYKSFPEIHATITNDKALVKAFFIECAEDGDFEKTKELVDQGVDVNAANSNGASALMLASFNGHHKVAFYLLDHKANVRHTDSGGFNALMLACESASPDLKLVRRLLTLGSDVNAYSNGKSTALMTAAKSGHLEIVKLLIENGASINVANSDHRVTPLIWAANGGHFSIVKLLLKNGADKHAKTVNNYTAASIANENGHYDIASFLK